MTYMDLQALRHYVRQAQKIIHETLSLESEDCKHGVCANCSYYAICHVNRTLQYLIKHEADKYNAKGELINDNR